ncbi:MAG: BON domain-containing protein [Verrucomicrobia bacterium]|nr:BON domain-containing protein [Verrucomicrobiota bacterium]
MKSKSITSLVLIVATGVFCAASPTLWATETDDRIEDSAQASYVYKTYLKDDAIKTVSADGVVTLTGTVAYDFHKGLAQDTVAGLPGVKNVDNQLVVKGESPAKNSDLWLTQQVKNTLLFHRSVNAIATEVSSKNGVVLLRGEASSLAQKELTGEYAADVDGVRSVNNEMTVAKTPAKPERTLLGKIDDSSITAQVKLALLTHRSTSAVKTEVKTVDGVVKVSGQADNAAERRLVTKLVKDIHGVTSLTNEMSVKGE